MTKGSERKAAFAFGVLFVAVLLGLAVVFPEPTAFQYTVFRIVLSLAAAGVAALVPGFLEVNVSTWVRAGGALGVFVVVYFYNPATLIVRATEQSPTAPTSEDVRPALDAMVHEFPAMSVLRIVSITSAVNGISAVAISPPYREFPNVVLFRYDTATRRWIRILEGLCLGIQPEVSKILDLHTIGLGIDFARPKSEEERRWMSAGSIKLGWVSVVYEEFIHVHPSGRETYYLDKQEFARLAKRLFPKMRDYRSTECTLFDMPELMSISLSHDSGRFMLVGRTLNRQRWTVTFTGIDGGGHLDQKILEATSLT